jgi:hypothetical protein
MASAVVIAAAGVAPGRLPTRCALRVGNRTSSAGEVAGEADLTPSGYICYRKGQNLGGPIVALGLCRPTRDGL